MQLCKSLISLCGIHSKIFLNQTKYVPGNLHLRDAAARFKAYVSRDFFIATKSHCVRYSKRGKSEINVQILLIFFGGGFLFFSARLSKSGLPFFCRFKYNLYSEKKIVIKSKNLSTDVISQNSKPPFYS